MELTHFNQHGNAKMVDVSLKNDTVRKAIAKGTIKMKPNTLQHIIDKKIKKGDVLHVAQIAAIMGAKKTSDIIPMCHNINLTGVDLEFNIIEEENKIDIYATVQTVGKTGVEMEALTAVNIAALTIYDMCKAIDKEMIISDIYLCEKLGGKSGHYVNKGENKNE